MVEVSGFWAGAMLHGQGVDVRALAAHFGGFDALEKVSAEALAERGIGAQKAAAWVATPSFVTRGVPLRLDDPRYPCELAALESPPAMVVVEGDLEAFEAPGVALVGTRHATPYGLSVARQMAAAVASAGQVVVSGLAAGIDGAAHRSATSWGRTIAVLGHGLAHTAPSTHRALRERILATGGALLSAFPDPQPPSKFTFPRRNPWIAGLSKRIVVVEAPKNSGAMLTAWAGMEIGREIWAVPGPLGGQHRGCFDLLRAGAELVYDLDEWARAALGQERAAPQERWLQSLYAGETLDEVARISRRDVPALIADLSLRELRGELVRMSNGRYAPAGNAA